MANIANKISIPQFFENKSIFVTGATGFIGRLLVEKLLRSCPGIKNIYVLLRSKQGKTVQERIKDITDIPLFETLKLQNKQALDKIIAVSGNTEQLGLGLSEDDRNRIIENVTIFFHNAASVRFDDLLKDAVLANTRSTREAVLLALQLKKVDVFVDTSTAYVNCDRIEVNEELYPAKWYWKDLITVAEEADEILLETLTEKCIKPLPNTYTFTKSIAEHCIDDLSKGRIPTAIVRPTIVIPTYSDPIPGWVDNLNGPSSVVVGTGKGVTRVVLTSEKTVYDHVYADNVVKALIISGWKKAISGDKDEVTIYNVSSDFNFAWNGSLKFGRTYQRNNPLETQLWPMHIRFVFDYYSFFILTLVYHILPALIVDGILRVAGKRPLLLRIQRKTFLANLTLLFFMRNLWNFKHKNYVNLRDSLVQSDIESFYFEHFDYKLTSKEMDNLLTVWYNGCRTYLVKEGPVTEKGIRKDKRLQLIEQIWIRFWQFLALYWLFFRYQIVSMLSNNICNYFELIN